LEVPKIKRAAASAAETKFLDSFANTSRAAKARAAAAREVVLVQHATRRALISATARFRLDPEAGGDQAAEWFDRQIKMVDGMTPYNRDRSNEEILALGPRMRGYVGGVEDALVEWQRVESNDWLSTRSLKLLESRGESVIGIDIRDADVLVDLTSPIDRETALSSQEGRDAVASMVPMPLNGFSDAQVPARLLARLVSDENSHLCRQVLFVDGGSDASVRGDSVW
jgi:hypothetical protein